MEFSKKRKTDDNGTVTTSPPSNAATTTTVLSHEDARKILQPFSQDQLLDILQTAVIRHLDVLEEVRSIADRDSALRKLFIRGLGWETTSDSLRSLFSAYGDLDEAIVILDKVTGKSKGYGFVTFKHVDGALLALKEPSKKIDGRITVTQLAAAGLSGGGSAANTSNGGDTSMRKIFVGNVPFEMSSEKLLGHFLMYGEIEEGPLGFDKATGKSRGFAFFVYKTEDGAKAAIVEPAKNIDGHQVHCKLAVDSKKGKPGGGNVGAGGIQGPSGVPGNGIAPQSSMPGPLPGSQYGVPGGLSYQGPPGLHNANYGMNSSFGSQRPSLMSNSGGHGSGLGSAYGSSQYGGPSMGGYGGLNNAGPSLNRLPPSSVGLPSGGYPTSGHYGLSSSGFPNQQDQPTTLSRVPPGGMYQGMPPY